MNTGRPNPVFLGAMAVVLGWGLAFSLACRLVPARAGIPGGNAGSAAGLVLQETRQAVSGDFYERADLYFHKGVEHAEARAITNDFFQRLYGTVAPSAHMHLEGRALADIMPWLRMATEMDPHNVEAYCVAAFWMSTDAARPDLAETVLDEAARNNPRDYRVYLERTRLYLRWQKPDRAQSSLAVAERLWPEPGTSDDMQTRLDRSEMLNYRALFHEMSGRPDLAADTMESVLTLFPERTHLLSYIQALRSGRKRTPAEVMRSFNRLMTAQQSAVSDGAGGGCLHGREPSGHGH